MSGNLSGNRLTPSGSTWRRWLFLLVALASCVVSGCGEAQDIPVHRVDRQLFEHKVSADGVMRAGRTTKLTVPSQVVRSVRVAWLKPEGTMVAEGDVVARFDPKEMERKLTDADIDKNRSNLEIGKSGVEKDQRIGELYSEAGIADLELQHAQDYQKTDSLVFSRRELVEDAIDEELAQERKEHAEANAETEKKLAVTELEILEIGRRQALSEIDEAEQGLAALEVRAPHAGLLTYERNWMGDPPTVGIEMFRGQGIAEIPDLDSMEAEVYVLEADAGGVAAGQRAEVTVEAFPDRPIEGRIQRVDPVAQPRFRGSPVQYFGVVVSFDLEGIEVRDLDFLKPGQRVRATLYLERDDEALVLPRQAVFEQDGQTTVWRKRANGFEPVEVQVGAAGLGLVVIQEGLQEGDEVALRRPDSVDSEQNDEPTNSGGNPLAAGG